MKIFGFIAMLIALALPMEAEAQLVSDGQTNVLDGVITNIPGGIIIGTNGTLTLLVITNSATVTNSSGNAVIGNNSSAKTNRVIVTDPGSVWQSAGNFSVGQSGSANELDILNGGLVTDAVGSVGGTSASSNNLVLVSGIGSTWTSTGYLYVGYGSYGNMLVVSNGGKVFSAGGSTIGRNSLGIPSTNTAVITGPGSSWSSGYFYLGYLDKGHDQLLINNGGSFVGSSTVDIGVYSGTNCLTVADAGSSLQCQTFRIGYTSTSNQCIVSNGATFTVASFSQPATVEGTFTLAAVTGAGSVWTNAGEFDFGESSNVLAITSGGMLVDNNGYIESSVGSSVIVAGANSLWNNLGDLHVAAGGAQVSITNGGMVADNYGYLGDNAGNNNCVALVSGAGSVWTNRYDLYVGNNGASNQLVVASSGTVFAQNLYLGGSASSTNNSLVLNGGSLMLTNLGLGTVNDLRGTLTLNSGLVRCTTLSVNNGASGKFIFNGGTLQMHNSTVNNGSALVVGDGVDAATLMLTTIGTSGGTHNFSNGLVVTNNGLFTGAGTVTGNVVIGNGGVFAPGTTNTFFVTINRGLMLSNGSTTVMGLNPIFGSACNVAGLTNVVYGGTLQLTNIGGIGATYAPGQSYKLFYSSHYSGAFTNVVPSSPGLGLRWDTSELTVDGVLRIFPAQKTPPIMRTAAMTGGNFVVSASSGTAYDTVYLLTSTKLASPIANWTCWSTNYFDTNGLVSITNLIVPGEPERYFRLQLP